jgi:hypothetical protein
MYIGILFNRLKLLLAFQFITYLFFSIQKDCRNFLFPITLNAPRITYMIKKITLICLSSLTFISFGQNSNEKLIRNYFKNNTEKIDLTQSTANSIEIDRAVEDKQDGLTHFYVRQTVNGLPVVNATAVFVKKGDLLILTGNRLVAGQKELAPKANPLAPNRLLEIIWKEISGAERTVLGAATKLNETKFSVQDAAISELAIPLELAYFYDGQSFRLIYETSLKIPKQDHWYNVYADAFTGEILKKNDWVVSCTFEGCSSQKHFNYNDITQTSMEHQLMMAPAPPPQTDSYRVFQLPVESPNHGGRSLVVGPFDSVASPYGWHDVNGVAGAEYTVTRGNNVRATEDADDNDIAGYSPDGGASLVFDFPYNGGAPTTYLDAAITNLFYMNNTMHDVWYRYGFTEDAGNFQDNNYGKGGLAGDYVDADAQDGSGTNNANFGTPPDGSNPRMQMFIWNSSATSNLLVVNSPSGFAGPYASTMASFGPQPPVIPITQDFVLVSGNGADSLDACATILNPGQLSGKIAVVRRGSCTFASKVEKCQQAGALAVIVVNNVATNPITMGGTSTTVNIPSIMVSQADGEAFITAIQAGTIINGSISDPQAVNSKDSDIDNMIIAHEYGHGISNRLTGGPNNTSCLGNDDQMGEGWSDWFGLMMTIEPGDLSTDSRGVGTYVTNASTTGTGIRPAPYSTSFSVNNYTYGASNNSGISKPHGIGFVWATMLWDLNWAFIADFGFDPNISTGTGGNNTVMKLVMEGMRLQPCEPGMVDGRDAILLADQLLYQGAHECLIWKVFAKRGLGFNAQQGDTDDRFDQVENFNVPLVCLAGLEENENNAQLLVYPNPTDGNISVALSDDTKITTVRVLDINGREVMTVNGSNNSIVNFDIFDFEFGVYFVEVNTANGTQTRKIIKE